MSSFVDGEGAVLTSEAAASVGDRTIPFDMDESIFLFQCLSKLSAPDLLSCGLVNKTFFRLCQDDMLWDQKCELLWVGKSGFESYCTVFHQINLSDSAWRTLKIKELKSLLKRRGVNSQRYYLEKSEFIEAAKRTTDKGSKRLTGKWFASFWYSKRFGTRQRPRADDITQCEWVMNFKESFNARYGRDTPMPEIRATFHPDFTYSSEPSFNHGQLTWKFFDEKSVQVGGYPPLVFRRYPNWTWTMENEYVIFYSQTPKWATLS